jgi:hypothetical protein
LKKFKIQDKSGCYTNVAVIRRGLDGLLEYPYDALESDPRYEGFFAAATHLDPRNEAHHRAWEDALHGFGHPLYQLLKTPPAYLHSYVQDPFTCRHHETCTEYQKSSCVYFSRKAPLCYDPPRGGEEVAVALLAIRDAWLTHHYMIIVPDSMTALRTQ